MAGSAAASAKSGSSDIVKTRRRGARGGAPDTRQIVKLVVLLAAAAWAGWLCVRAAAVEVLARSNPIAAAKLAPGDPRVSAGLANLEFRLSQGAVSPAASARAIQGLRRAPLSSDPFFFAGLNSLIRDDRQGALPLIKEARRRHPRSRTARLVYLDQVLRSGETAEAAVEIAALSRLVPEAARVLMPELARYAADPKTAPALIEALRPDANLREGVLEQLALNKADPEIILRLAASGPRPSAQKDVPVWQGRMLMTLVERGQIGRARTVWADLAGVDVKRLGTGVYDGAFRGEPGPPPFNWRFLESSAGVAEPTRAPALQVEYYGRANAELASQLLQLDPGRHLLSMTVSGNAPSAGGNVVWSLFCLGGKTPIAVLPVEEISYTTKRLAVGFSVPANCPAQWLRLTGTPAEFPAAHSITVADLRIGKGG